jgi:glutamate dehydrogenase/leucine dehydrogenase
MEAAFAAAAYSPAQGGVVDTKLEAEKTKILVIRGSGVVGSYIVEHLVRRCERPFVFSVRSGTCRTSSGFAAT